MKHKEAIVFTSDYMDGAIFTGEDTCLSFFRQMYPKKKNLRLRRWSYGTTNYTLLNHTTPVLGWGEKLQVIRIDPTYKEMP